MFSHIMIGANSIDESKKFYDAILGELGYKPGMVDPKGRCFYFGENAVFALSSLSLSLAGRLQVFRRGPALQVEETRCCCGGNAGHADSKGISRRLASRSSIQRDPPGGVFAHD